MKLSIRNIAKLKEADIEINGISVIAGPNNTGKTTVGKSLFLVYNTFSNTKYKEKISKRYSIMQRFSKYFEDELFIDESDYINTIRFVDSILSSKNKFESIDEFKNNIFDGIEEDLYFLNISSDEKEKFVENVIDIINITKSDFLLKNLDLTLRNEFGGQYFNIYKYVDSKIEFSKENKKVSILLTKDGNKINDDYDMSENFVYIDDPLFLDFSSNISIAQLKNKNTYTHRNDLRKKIYDTGADDVALEIINESKFEEIYKHFDFVCSGSILNKKNGFVYRETEDSEGLKLRNLSSGLKIFIILKQLIISGVIKEKSTVILDEPEIHLHPEWQIIFAELLVLLQKTFNLHILLTTHSPYFLRAIQVYAAKHEIADKCKYYLSRLEADGAYIDDVTEDTEKIFASLARPFQALEDEEANI